MDKEKPQPRTFWCFISYRHADNKEPGRQWATWLHQQIETYEVPSDLVGTVNGRGDTIPERIFPVFRDEDELPADADLSSPIYRALDASKFLVVLCSPRAVQSTYVADEIAYYKKIGRSDRVLAAILDGQPQDSFPLPLRHPVDEHGVPIPDQHAEPIAADFRLPDDTQGWTSPEAYRQALLTAGTERREIERRVTDYKARLELGKLKIIAGVLGLPLGTLTQRDKAYQLEKERRRARIFRRVTAAMAVLLIAAIAGGVFASIKKAEAETQRQAAETQRQAAVSARDAEAAQRAIAETRRVEADDARTVADTRRTEAEQAKALAETRRIESESRLARSNIQLADRLTREGNTPDAAEALWAVPEQERQWEWGYLLGRAYPETGFFTTRTPADSATPQEAALDPSGRRGAFWDSRALSDDGKSIPGTLKWIHVQDDAVPKQGAIPVEHGVIQAAWSRNGLLAILDGPFLRVFDAEAREIGKPQSIIAEDDIITALQFLDADGTRLLAKAGENWIVFQVSKDGVAESKRIKEVTEMERPADVSPDGRQWLGVSTDNGATLYDIDGKVVDKFTGVWQARGAFAADGSLAIATIDEAVIVRTPKGRHIAVSKTGEVSERGPTVSVQWVGRRLYVRTPHLVRAWDNPAEAKPGGSPNAAWDFDSGETTLAMAASGSWLAVALTNGAIAISPVDSSEETEYLLGHQGYAQDLRFAFDDYLASAGADGTLRHWALTRNTRSGTVLKDIQNPLFKGHEADWNKITEYDPNLPPLTGGPGIPFGTMIKVPSPDGTRQASAGQDGQLRLWRGEKGTEPALALLTPGSMVQTLAWSSDGRSLAGQFLTPGEDWTYQKQWTTAPWTRQQLGIDASADWRRAFQLKGNERFRQEWTKRVSAR